MSFSPTVGTSTTKDDVLVHQWSDKRIDKIPFYWKHCVHPHILLTIPGCFYDSTLYDEEHDLSCWKAGIDYLHSLSNETLYTEINNEFWLRLHQIIAEPTYRKIATVKFLTGQGFRSGYGFRYRLSDPSILFHHSLTTIDGKQELAQYWSDADVRIWRKLQKQIQSYAVAHPESRTAPFDHFMMKHQLQPRQWQILKKIAFVPETQPASAVPAALQSWSTTVVSQLQQMVQLQNSNKNLISSSLSPSSSSSVLGNELWSRLSEWHDGFTKISPFRYGNGRVIRAWLGAICLSFGYLPLPCSPKSDYIRACATTKQLREFFMNQNRILTMFVVVPPPFASSSTTTTETTAASEAEDLSTHIRTKLHLDTISCGHNDTTIVKSITTDVKSTDVKSESDVGKTKPKLTQVRWQINMADVTGRDLETMIDQEATKESDWLSIAELAYVMKRNDLIAILMKKKCISLARDMHRMSPSLSSFVVLLSKIKMNTNRF